MSSYHHGNLREVLVATAVELGREKGPEGIVLREVARRAGVSHNAAYRHFSDRSDLLHAVGEVALAELSAAMEAKVSRVRTADRAQRALRRLRATGQAYVECALAEPGLFRVAFNQAHLGELSGPYDLLSAALDACLEAGVMAPEKREGAELSCWAGVHGFSLLYGSGPLQDTPRRQRDADLNRLLDRIEDSLR